MGPMHRFAFAILTLGFAMSLGGPSAWAAEASRSAASEAFTLLEELRFGAFGHNLGMKESSMDGSVEILSSPIHVSEDANVTLNALLNPRFAVGAQVSTRRLTSYVFAGLNWRFPVTDGLFVETEFGGAVNTAPVVPTPLRIDIGCPVTFRESIGLGFALTGNVDIVGSIEHISHASLCGKPNPGLTSTGVRIGYKF